MNENINLCEILKDCPKNTKFYSSIIGKCLFQRITPENCIRCISPGNIYTTYSSKGRFEKFGECVLFPSKDQRDWLKFKAPWLKKPKFDPKTLKAFDRILVRNSCIDNWGCSFFSHHRKGKLFPFLTCGANVIKYCIPYNDDTKHLIGTNDEAPEYYRYWEE